MIGFIIITYLKDWFKNLLIRDRVNNINRYYEKKQLTAGQLSGIITAGQLSCKSFAVYAKSVNSEDVLHLKYGAVITISWIDEFLCNSNGVCNEKWDFWKFVNP